LLSRSRELRQCLDGSDACDPSQLSGDVALCGAAKLRGIAGIGTIEALAKLPVVRFLGNLLLSFAAEQSAVAVAHTFQAILEVVVVIGFFCLLFLVFGEL